MVSFWAGIFATISTGLAVAAPFCLPLLIGSAISGAISGAISLLAVFLQQEPDQENETMREIERRLGQQEAEEERRRNEEKRKELEAERKELEVERKQLEETVAEMRRKAEESQKTSRKDLQRKELFEEQRRAAEASQEEERRRKEGEEMARLAEMERCIEQREQELQESINQAKKQIKEEQARARSGIQATQWPTKEEFHAAREKVRYNPLAFHFAIVGKAGCGKSSLINAFLNLKPGEPGAAKTGVTETTLEIHRYPDPGTQPPRPWTVWFDVPGAGTQRISHWNYFTKQALFVFDIIILAIGDRFEETDCQIIRSCREFKIPCFIVRSKADQHIENMIKEQDDEYEGRFENHKLFQEFRQSFMEMTQKMVTEELERAGLPHQEVYCVSRLNLRKTYNSSLHGGDIPPILLDEKELVGQLMFAACQRRGSNKETSQLEEYLSKAKAAFTLAGSSVELRKGTSEPFSDNFENPTSNTGDRGHWRYSGALNTQGYRGRGRRGRRGGYGGRDERGGRGGHGG